MKRIFYAALVALSSISALTNAEEIKFLDRVWTTSEPDPDFSIAKGDGDGGAILADRGSISTIWEKGGQIEFEFLFIGKPPVKDPAQQRSLSNHLLAGIRATGQKLNPPYELAGQRLIRLRPEQAIFEEPLAEGDPRRIFDRKIPSTPPYVWHKFSYDESDGAFNFKLNGNTVFVDNPVPIAAPEKGNLLIITPREFNGYPNMMLLRPVPAKK